jgi:hypothetical protein
MAQITGYGATYIVLADSSSQFRWGFVVVCLFPVHPLQRPKREPNRTPQHGLIQESNLIHQDLVDFIARKAEISHCGRGA